MGLECRNIGEQPPFERLAALLDLGLHLLVVGLVALLGVFAGRRVGERDRLARQRRGGGPTQTALVPPPPPPPRTHPPGGSGAAALATALEPGSQLEDLAAAATESVGEGDDAVVEIQRHGRVRPRRAGVAGAGRAETQAVARSVLWIIARRYDETGDERGAH